MTSARSLSAARKSGSGDVRSAAIELLRCDQRRIGSSGSGGSGGPGGGSGFWHFDDCSATSHFLADSSGFGANAQQALNAACVPGISGQGVQIRSADEIKSGDRLELAFQVIGIEEEISVEAVVRRVTQHERGTLHVWEAGCEFEGLAPRLSQKLFQFVFAQQRAQARNRRVA